MDHLLLFTFKVLLLADEESCVAAIACERPYAGEAFAKLWGFGCVSVLYQGALNMVTLHNGFKCLPGKMD